MYTHAYTNLSQPLPHTFYASHFLFEPHFLFIPIPPITHSNPFSYSFQLPFLTHSIPAILILIIFPVYPNNSLPPTSQLVFNSRFSVPARGESGPLLSLSCFQSFCLQALYKGVFPYLWCLRLAHKWLKHFLSVGSFWDKFVMEAL